MPKNKLIIVVAPYGYWWLHDWNTKDHGYIKTGAMKPEIDLKENPESVFEKLVENQILPAGTQFADAVPMDININHQIDDTPSRQGCQRGPAAQVTQQTVPVTQSVTQEPLKDGEFSLESIKAGDTVKGMKVISVSRFSDCCTENKNNSVPFGPENFSVTFGGEKTISGTYDYGHNEMSLLDQVCFATDKESQATLPSLADENHSSFCFSNQDLAQKEFGPATGTGSATVVIDEYQMIGFPAAVEDSAKLVKLVSKKQSQ